MAHPRRTLDREVHRHLQLYLPLFKFLLDLRFVVDWTCLQQQRACSLGGLFSLRKCPHPRLASGPAHAHFTLPPSANSTARESNLSQPAADLRLFFLFSLIHTHIPPSPSDPRPTTAIHRHTLHKPHTMDLLNSYYPQEPSCARMPAL